MAADKSECAHIPPLNWEPKKVDLAAERDKDRLTPWEEWEWAYRRWEDAYDRMKREEKYLEWVERNLNV